MRLKGISNRWFLIFFGTLLTVLVAAPVLLMWYVTPEGQVFTGTSVYSPIDLPVYFADIKQVAQGHWLVHDLFTTEGPQRGMFHILWVVLGSVARLFDLEPWMVFHSARVALAPFLVWSLWWGIKQWLPRHVWRFGLVMAVFGSGTGVLLNRWLEKGDISEIGLDFWVPEGFVFMSSLQSPHYMLALSLFSLVLAAWFKATKQTGTQAKVKWTLVSGVLASVLFSFHPFHIFTIGLILIAHAVSLLMLNHKHHSSIWWMLPLWGACALPGAGYQLWLQWGDEVLQARSLQSKTPTPSFATVYLSFAALWVFGLVGARRLWKTHREAGLFLLVWGVVQTLALFAPIQINRRFVMGLQIDLALLATVGWYVIFYGVKQHTTGFLKRTNWLLVIWRHAVGPAVAIFIFGFSSIVAFMTYLRAPADIPDLLYMPEAQKKAYEWIEQNSAEDDVVVALGWPAILLPGETGRSTYTAHWHETLRWEEKYAEVQQLLSSKDEKRVSQLLNQTSAAYVLLSPKQGFQVPTNRLERGFADQSWRVFRVVSLP